MTQIPVINVNNNCSTGSTALLQARNAVASGMVDCAMALGFERMQRGSLKSNWSDRTPPLGKDDIQFFVLFFSIYPYIVLYIF